VSDLDGPEVGRSAAGASPSLEYLQEQQAYYSGSSARVRRLYLGSEVVLLILLVVSIVINGDESVPRRVLQLVAGAAALVRGLAGIFKWHDRWTTYRLSAETLRGEKVLFQAGGGDYFGVPNRDVVLAERVVGYGKREVLGWAAAQRAQGPNESPGGVERPGTDVPARPTD
jgi:hypothetical protein